MRRCTHEKADGSTCRAPATAGGDLCFWHNPATKKRAAAARRQGGKRRQGQGARQKAAASAAKKKAPKKKPQAVNVSEEQLVVQSGARLSSAQLEEYLASAIIKGVNGQLSAPVLNNIVRLINVYENFLNKKKDGGDVERARALTPEQMHKAMLLRLPDAVVLAEAKRRGGGPATGSAAGRAAGNGAAAARPQPDPPATRAAVGDGDEGAAPPPRPGNGGPDAGGRPEGESSPPHDLGLAQDAPVRTRW
jgi:hypothetical protein